MKSCTAVFGSASDPETVLLHIDDITLIDLG
jgi:hypothetical protein